MPTLDEYIRSTDDKISQLVHMRELLRNARELYDLGLIPAPTAVTIRDSFVTEVRSIGTQLAAEVTIT